MSKKTPILTSPSGISTGSTPLVLRDLEKNYGSTRVLNGIQLTLKRGSITGLLGRNGAGKTTLLRCCLGLLQPDSGSVTLLGEEAWNSSEHVRRRIGYVSQAFDQLGWLRVKTAIQLVSSFYDSWDDSLVNQCLDESQLDINKKIMDLSHGQQQLVAIMMVIGHRPPLLFLDEPVSGLDPVARQNFLRLLLRLNDELEQTILFSTHIVTDIERVAADVAILSQGKITFHGDLGSLKDSVRCVYMDRDRVPGSILEQPGVIASRTDGSRLQLWVQTSEVDLKAFELKSHPIVEEAVGLEELFEGMTS